MVMNELFEKLRILQDVLSRKNEVENQITEVPKQLSNQEELLSKRKTSYVEKNSKYEDMRGNINRLKADLFEIESKRENAEKGMDSVDTQREYEILEKEINDAIAEENNVRKQIQKQMDDFKALDDEIKREEDFIAQSENDLLESKKKTNKEIDNLKSELKELEAEELKISEGLQDETLFKFERIIKNKQGKGIVSVKGNVCTGCHMILPAQFANEVQNGTDLKYCPYCSRVLFYEQHEISDEENEAAFDDANIGGLVDLDISN
ncbi:MAG: nucleic acid-binding protein [Treponema sp.]|nr:MAG: nucleic acid-binding protein [Treponema sp.]